MKSSKPSDIKSGRTPGMQPISDVEIERLQGRFSALEESLVDLYSFLPFGMHTLDTDGVFRKINRFEQETLGYEVSESIAKKKFSDFLSPDSSEPYALFLENPSRYLYPSGVSIRLIAKSGVVLPFLLSQSFHTTDSKDALDYVLFSDASAGLLDDNKRIAAIVFESRLGIMVTNSNKEILSVNSAFTEMTGFSEEEVIGKMPSILSSGRHDKAFFSEMWRTINETGKWQGQIWNKRKSGGFYAQLLTITEVRDEKKHLINYVGEMADISQELILKETIERLAYYDPLTSLPNRRLLMDRLEQALATISRQKSKGSVLFLGLDNFKLINNARGQDCGDMLLKQVAERLVACVRSEDTVARMGSDEYVMLLGNLGEDTKHAATMANAACNKIRAALSVPFDLDGIVYSITGSIGVAMIEDASLTPTELLTQADIAMYEAKKGGRNAQRFFDEKMQVAVLAHTELDAALRSALTKNELELFYQLQVDETGKAIGVEALVRWNHPRRGLLSPDEFIPFAEESALICDLGRWVLNAACAQLQQWAGDAVFGELPVSVNISGREFRDTGFVQQVESVLKNFKVRSGALRLELTEGMLVEKFDVTVKCMNALIALGVLIGLDDLGTGFTSLKYIHEYPVSRLRIDKSFVSSLIETGRAIVIVRTIIAMAKALGIEVIAEGVETTAQLEILLSEGCTQFQGYHFAEPMPLESFEAFLRTRPA